MKDEDSHLSDQQLLLDVDGGLSARDQKPVRAHLDACWKCRARRQELENAIIDFVRVHQREFDTRIPPAAGPRALLKAQLAQLSATEPNGNSSRFMLPRGYAWAVSISGLLVLGLFLAGISWRSHSRRPAVIVSTPDSSLT